jgi:hypothetical protein
MVEQRMERDLTTRILALLAPHVKMTYWTPRPLLKFFLLLTCQPPSAALNPRNLLHLSVTPTTLLQTKMNSLFPERRLTRSPHRFNVVLMELPRVQSQRRLHLPVELCPMLRNLGTVVTLVVEQIRHIQCWRKCFNHASNYAR